jgi:hypothetical protein
MLLIIEHLFTGDYFTAHRNLMASRLAWRFIKLVEMLHLLYKSGGFGREVFNSP